MMVLNCLDQLLMSLLSNKQGLQTGFIHKVINALDGNLPNDKATQKFPISIL